MDLENFGSESLYFDEAQPPEVLRLMHLAAEDYHGGAEAHLQAALDMAPDSLIVLVGLYRYYFYNARYADALPVAHRVMAVIAPRIAFPAEWRRIDRYALLKGVSRSMSLVRFYLSALKAAGYVNLRLRNFAEGRQMLEKVVDLDDADRLGARVLLDVLCAHKADVLPFPLRPAVQETVS